MVHIPRVLLSYLSTALGVTGTTIATLKSLYGPSRVTLQAHQAWAIHKAGFTRPTDENRRQLQLILNSLAGSANSVDDLVRQAEIWQFQQQLMLDGDRALRDLARKAFADIEKAAIDTVKAMLNEQQRNSLLGKVFAKRRGREGGVVLEWIKTAPGKHSPTEISELSAKISWLKEAGVDK